LLTVVSSCCSGIACIIHGVLLTRVGCGCDPRLTDTRLQYIRFGGGSVAGAIRGHHEHRGAASHRAHEAIDELHRLGRLSLSRRVSLLAWHCGVSHR